MNPVSAISAYSKTTGASPLTGGAGENPAARPAGKQTSNFGKLVNDFVANTNDAQQASNQAVQDLATGNTDNIQQVVLAVANAEMSFQLFMEIRNKLIDSYNELMRMQF